MLVRILLIIFYLSVPVLIIYLTRISKIIHKIGAVVLAYIIGLMIGNIGIFPSPTRALRTILAGKTNLPSSDLLPYLELGKIGQADFLANQIAGVQDLLMTIVIPLAIPLLLFSMDIRRWLKLAKGALLSLVLGMVSLILVIFAGFFLFQDKIPELWKVSGMLVGVYTGGTPNLAAIGTALEVDPNIFILTHTYEMIAGAMVLIFLLTSAQRIFNLFLPSFREQEHGAEYTMIGQGGEMGSFEGILKRKNLIPLLKALTLSVLIFAIGGALSFLVREQEKMLVVVLTITSLGLLFSMIKSVNRIDKTFQVGMYFVIVFSLVVASMGDLRNMFSMGFLNLFVLVAFGIFGTMLVHIFLAWIFKVDTDTTIITITALTFSPPFVPVVAGALRNKDVIITGLTTGIIGYAIGNYAGFFVAYILKGF
jgi:uncharacterized membrane protein